MKKRILEFIFYLIIIGAIIIATRYLSFHNNSFIDVSGHVNNYVVDEDIYFTLEDNENTYIIDKSLIGILKFEEFIKNIDKFTTIIVKAGRVLGDNQIFYVYDIKIDNVNYLLFEDSNIIMNLKNNSFIIIIVFLIILAVFEGLSITINIIKALKKK